MVITWRVVHTFDLGEVLHLKGVPTTNVDYFVQGWTKGTSASTMEEFPKIIHRTLHVLLTHVEVTTD
jgi:hypothetical protein